MKFAEMPVKEAEGALLAHSIRAEGVSFKKGRKLSPDDIDLLSAKGIRTVFAAHLDEDDVPEDEAAARLAEALLAPGLTASAPFTGRANLFAEGAGLFLINRQSIDAINAVHEAITLATLSPHEAVQPGQMVATVKIIPFACPRAALEKACVLAKDGKALGLAPFEAQRYGLISTTLPGMKESLLDKTRDVLGARIGALDGTLAGERRCPHETEALQAALTSMAPVSDILLVSGASAIVDRQDVVPAAIEAAGGKVLHFGMPVDPGNLLLLGELNGKPVLGLPGCARSPKLNGADWVMQRLAAKLPATSAEIMGLGVGGLLKEISSRPQPRAAANMPREGGKVTARPARPRIAAILLAAGRSTRMGGPNKLLTDVDGKTMLRHVAETAAAAQLDEIIAVTGHQHEAVAHELSGIARLSCVHNPDYAAGLASSLKKGASEAAVRKADAAIILLGDMPDISPETLNRLIAAYDPEEGRLICVPTFEGRRGNPVLWDARFFEEMQALTGDMGAKPLIASYEEAVCEVPVPDPAIHRDFDTPEALAARTQPPHSQTR